MSKKRVMCSMEIYIRKCPNCKKEIKIRNKYYFHNVEAKRTLCLSCSSRLRMQGIKNSRFKDITGLTFNNLTAIRPVKTRKSVDGNSSGFYWEFKCVCGNSTIRLANAVKSGACKSCGCLSYKVNLGNKHGLWRGYGEISKTYYKQIQRGAQGHGRRARKFDFNLTIEYLWNLFLKQNRKCALSGIELQFGTLAKVKGKREQTASLDRIDSSKDYVEGNVQWIHKDINKMKQDFPEHYFIEMCGRIANFKNQKYALAR